MSRRTVAERFWEKVSIGGPNECWEWTACRTRLGYGRIAYMGRVESAHRLAWILANGEPPPRMEVRHRCDNPPCVNLAHLELGTHLDNMRDLWRRGRGRPGRGPGAKNSQARLTWPQVTAIRAAAADGMTHRAIADCYGVNRSTITQIVAGKSWKTA